MIDVRFVPIENWPGEPRKSRRDSPFRGSWKNTLDTLERELAHLKAKDILVQAYLTRDDIRNDGWPRAGSKPRSVRPAGSFPSRATRTTSGRATCGRSRLLFQRYGRLSGMG